MNCLLLPDTQAKLSEDNLPTLQYLDHYILKDTSQVTHIKQVLKAQVGDCIKVGIKSGCLGEARIKRIENGHIELENIDCNTLPPPKLDLTVVLALCRPKVLRRLIIDMTAIGVRRIVLVNSYRTQKSYWQSPMLQRLDEFVDAGLAQGIDTIAPMIDCHTRFKPFVEDMLSHWTQANLQSAIVAHPYASKTFTDYQRDHALPQIICIGAEGGWIDYEVKLLQSSGCTPVSFGSRILRTEAVVNVLCGRYIG